MSTEIAIALIVMLVLLFIKVPVFLSGSSSARVRTGSSGGASRITSRGSQLASSRHRQLANKIALILIFAHPLFLTSGCWAG